MNTKFFASALIAAATLVAAPSFAADNISGEVGYVPPAPVASTSTLTRAMVQHEYVRAQRNDQLAETGEGADVGAVTSAKSTLTRDAVRAQAAAAAQHGQLGGGLV
jgi:hypothetical protein